MTKLQLSNSLLTDFNNWYKLRKKEKQESKMKPQSDRTFINHKPAKMSLFFTFL